MSTPNFSNFISNFSGSSNIDIVSSVNSVSVPCPTNPTTSQEVNGNYFCIGNLLIQFNTNGILSNQKTNNYTIPFPISYDSNPYTIMLTATNSTGSGGNTVNVTLQSFTTTDFKFKLSTNDGWVNFIVIGPRPSSLYTSSS